MAAVELPLPDELFGLTFNYLDAPSLLRCMQVCKLFHSIISESTHLVYKIELSASYMEDNEHASMDTITRLNHLREYNQMWNDMTWISSGSIPMSDGHCWEFIGGILAQSNRGNQLSLVQLPCKLKGIPEKRWSVPFDFGIRDFTLDISQDLIVLLELVGTLPQVSCKIHLRTFSGEYHPCTTVKQIIHASADLHTDCSFLMQICGNHLGILFCDQFDDASPNSFLVWNWQTGHQEVCIHALEFQSFSFITEDLVLAAILGSDAEPSLQVLSLAAFNYPIYSLDDIPHICELQYPEVKGVADYFLIRAEPTPTWKPPASLGAPFYGSRRDFIFAISLRVLSSDAHETTVLFVPRSTLLSEVERSHNTPCRNVPWDAWGPNGTRMIWREPSEVWVCYSYGMKFVQGLRWKNGREARIYDFNPYAARRCVKTSVSSPTTWKHLKRQSKPSGRCQSFCEKIVTRLPGRVATIKLADTDHGWEACMIGEDHIVMIQPRTSTYGYMAM